MMPCIMKHVHSANIGKEKFREDSHLYQKSFIFLEYTSCNQLTLLIFLGVWPENADGTDVNTADRSHDRKVMATGEKTFFHYENLSHNPLRGTNFAIHHSGWFFYWTGDDFGKVKLFTHPVIQPKVSSNDFRFYTIKLFVYGILKLMMNFFSSP